MTPHRWWATAVAVGIWLGMLVGWAARAADWPVGAVAVGPALVGIVVAGASVRWRGSALWRGPVRWRGPARWRGSAGPARVAAAALAALALGALTAEGYLVMARPSGLEECAQRRATVAAVVRLRGDPAAVRGPFAGWRAAGTAESVTCRGTDGLVRQWTGRFPVLLRAPGAEPEQIRRGATAQVHGRLEETTLWQAQGPVIRVARLGAVAGPGPPLSWVAAARDDMWRAYADRSPDAAALVAGLAIGDDSRQSAELADAMRAAGLSHLTAVSGGNISIVAGLVLGIATWLGLGLQARIAAGVVAVVGYVVVVGGEASVLRAAVMGVVALLAVLRGGPRGGVGLLAGAVAVLLLVLPSLAVSWAMVLSVAATFGIVTVGPAMQRKLRQMLPRLPPAVVAAITVTLAAQIATAPALAAMSGTLSLAGVWANLLAAPLVLPITVLGLVVLLAAPASVEVASAAARAAEPFGWLLARIATGAASQPGASIQWADGAMGAATVAALVTVAAAVVWASARWGRHRGVGHRRMVPFAAAIIAAVLIGGYRLIVPVGGGVPPDWSVVVCDVGQGDAILLRAAPDTAVMIDVGREPDLVRRCLHAAGVATVELLLLTHFDDDHVGAFADVLAAVPVSHVVVTPLAEPSEGAAAVIAASRGSGVPLATATAGAVMQVGSVALRILWPQRIIRSGASDGNNASLVTLASVSGMRLLLTGDIEPEAQRAIRSRHDPPKVDVVTLPHHGSARQDPEFLPWTGAGIVLVSAGRGNRYGHPRPEALGLVARIGAVLGRTDTDGTLALVVREGRIVLVGSG